MLICVAKLPLEETSMLDLPPEEIYFVDGSNGVLHAYDFVYNVTAKVGSTLIAYIHDDVEIFGDDWATWVEEEFDDPTVGLVGFGGATRHGTPDLYKRPYKLTNLARFNYHSNQQDAEQHGQRFTGAMDVAVLDGFVLVVRRELLDKAGGWPVESPIKFHCYDYWLCCVARRHGYRIRMVGVSCHHHGGGTSTRPEYEEWLRREFGKTDQQVHEEAHRYVWEEFRDVLPWEVKA
jgi:GT2 family glycosyltransferase